MPIIEQLKYRYTYWESILERKHWVMYLYPPLADIHELEEVLAKARSPVAKVIEDHARAYMTEGKEPPAAIAGAVMNFVDDVAVGRTPVLRAGDYISVRNFLRQKPG